MKELLKKAKETKTVDELKTLLSENNLNLDDKNVEKLYSRIHSDEELSDEKLEGLSGGARGNWFSDYIYKSVTCPRCHKTIKIDNGTWWGKCRNCGYEGEFRR